MAPCGGLELMTEMAYLLVQDSCGSGVLVRMSHVRRSGGLLGSKSEQERRLWVE